MRLLHWLKTYFKATLRTITAAIVVTRLEKGSRYEELVGRLRGGSSLPDGQRDPVVYARVVGRLLPILPPWSMGRCLKRSLILLHLWSRCGLTPALHLGVRESEPGAVEGHAWLTIEELDGFARAGSSSGYLPVVEL